jgi:hypothetical protein
MLVGPFLEFQPPIFILSFIISQLLSIKFPGMKFYLMKKNKKFRIHHAYAGGLLALIASLSGHPFWFNIGLGGMVQDVLNHLYKVLKRSIKF